MVYIVYIYIYYIWCLWQVMVLSFPHDHHMILVLGSQYWTVSVRCRCDDLRSLLLSILHSPGPTCEMCRISWKAPVCRVAFYMCRSWHFDSHNSDGASLMLSAEQCNLSPSNWRQWPMIIYYICVHGGVHVPIHRCIGKLLSHGWHSIFI